MLFLMILCMSLRPGHGIILISSHKVKNWRGKKTVELKNESLNYKNGYFSEESQGSKIDQR